MAIALPSFFSTKVFGLVPVWILLLIVLGLILYFYVF